MANRPVAFALTPALANREILDYSDPSDTKLFKAATEKLSIDYDCDSENLPLFLAQLRDRAAVYDWLALLPHSQGRKRRDDQGLDRILWRAELRRRQAPFRHLRQFGDQIGAGFGDVVSLHHGDAH
ncbi:hypothetical protein MHU86_21138 [Fragilaria crotonensis]|nr:hypothetical protein MHU86_21138 [Fragilaria crotonensis]